jgi:Pentapeptide repeats (8 copies)
MYWGSGLTVGLLRLAAPEAFGQMNLGLVNVGLVNLGLVNVGLVNPGW